MNSENPFSGRIKELGAQREGPITKQEAILLGLPIPVEGSEETETLSERIDANLLPRTRGEILLENVRHGLRIERALAEEKTLATGGLTTVLTPAHQTETSLEEGNRVIDITDSIPADTLEV